ncbi:tRNA-dihydrouridine synthase, partial [Streptococcus pluranimalium]
MVGRAAMNNPHIFTQINHFFETGEELPDLPFAKKLDIAEEHLKRLVALKGEMIAVREFRGLAPHYLRGTAGAAKVRGAVSRAESFNEVHNLFNTIR